MRRLRPQAEPRPQPPPQAPDIDPVGIVYDHVLTRSVRDSAAVLDATCGNVSADRWRCPPPLRPYLEEVSADPGQLRLALATGPSFGLPCDREIDDAVRATASWCETLGHDVEEVTFDVDIEAFARDFLVLWSEIPTGVVRMLTGVLGARPDRAGFEQFTWELVEHGERCTSGDVWLAWRGAIDSLTAALTTSLADFDALLAPVAGELPPVIGHLDPRLGLDTIIARSMPFAAFTAPANTAGLPAMSIPLHQSARGLPIGIQVIGRWGDEATLFRLAGQLELTHPWVDRLPPLFT